MRATLPASLSVVALGVLWGIYWMPLRQLDAVAASGPWSTLAIVVVATLCLAPAAWHGRRHLRGASRRGLASAFLGGVSLVAYSNALVYGHVAVVILLFYLTPIWSTLIARVFLAHHVSWWRYLAVAIGLGGIGLVLYGRHGDLPLPYGLGDWLGLASGLIWAVASTGIFAHSRTPPAETAFVFCAGGLVSAVALAAVLSPGGPPGVEPTFHVAAIAWTAFIAVLWWAAATTVLMWANQLLDAPRVGILFMSEAVVGAVSAALFAGEPFGWAMALGAVLVIGAGVLETLPARRDARPVQESVGR